MSEPFYTMDDWAKQMDQRAARALCDKAWVAAVHNLGMRNNPEELYNDMLGYCGFDSWLLGSAQPDVFLAKLAELSGPHGKTLFQVWKVKHADKQV